jgi:monovalent cation/hydrogen antiporter
VAFALAAILSPTDPVAVGAMTAGAPLPARLLHILEGEALLNDATGLVCFSFAVTAALTGSFSLAGASLSFLVVGGGGALAGLVMTGIVGWLNRWLVRRAGEEPATQILISVLIPFAAYLAAESVHVSGILAAAVAGIAMHYGELSGRRLAATRIQRKVVWDTMQFALNGIIFILLGMQLPHMLGILPHVAATIGAGSAWRLSAYVLVVTLVLGALRFLWVWLSMHVTVFRAARRGEGGAMPRTRLVTLAAAAGVRGAITLAGILTLPGAMPDGSAFPARDAAIFLAMGVILLSLLVASIGLPLLARNLAADLPSPRRHIEAGARMAATEAAIRRINAIVGEPLADSHAAAIRAEAAAHLLDMYRRRLDYGNAEGEHAKDMQGVARAERRLRLEALRAERDELFRLLRERCIDDGVHRQLTREIDLMEASLTRGATA